MAVSDTAKNASIVLSSAPLIGVAFEALLPVLEAFKKSQAVVKGLESLFKQVDRLIGYLNEVFTFIQESEEEDSAEEVAKSDEKIQSILYVLEKCIVAARDLQEMHNDKRTSRIKNAWNAEGQSKILKALKGEVNTVVLERSLIDTMKTYQCFSQMRPFLETTSTKLTQIYDLVVEMDSKIHARFDGFEQRLEAFTTTRPVSPPPTDLSTRTGISAYVPHTENYVKRKGEMRELRDAILPANTLTAGGVSDQSSSASVAVVSGMGDAGKTTLVAAIVRLQCVQEAFPEGIAWIKVGQKTLSYTDLQVLYKKVLRKLQIKINDLPAGNEIQFEAAKEQEAKEELREVVGRVLRTKKVLLVLDAMWHPEDIGWFWFGIPGKSPCCKLIITTRSPKALKNVKEARQIALWDLSTDEAVELLTLESECDRFVGVYLERAQAIVKRCGYLPLAVRTLGMMMRLSNSRDRLTLEKALEAMEGILVMNDGSAKYLLAVLDLYFSPNVHGGTKAATQLKRFFVSFACVFSDPYEKSPWIAADVVEALFRAVCESDEASECDEAPKVRTLDRTPRPVEGQMLEKLLSFGLLDMRTPSTGREYRVHHGMQQEYGVSAREYYEETQRREWHSKLILGFGELNGRSQSDQSKVVDWIPGHLKETKERGLLSPFECT